jgi:hypothetical protein
MTVFSVHRLSASKDIDIFSNKTTSTAVFRVSVTYACEHTTVYVFIKTIHRDYQLKHWQYNVALWRVRVTIIASEK